MSRLRSVILDELELPLRSPFVTSFGTERRRRFLIVQVRGATGETGWGECVAARDPLYSSETVDTASWAIRTQILPRLSGVEEVEPALFRQRTAPIQGHRMAKAAVEMALWDLQARERKVSLAVALGAKRRRVEVGVSVGIPATVERLLREVRGYVDEGYRRVKLKVRPGWDAVPVASVRREFPELRLWVDANQAYSPNASRRIARWAARYDVEQVEQPFPERALRAHAELQRGAPFRVCLDESIVDSSSLEDALETRALRSLNIKPGRVGGLLPSLGLARRATRGRVRPWVGGMLESGIGRAQNLALAAVSLFSLPPDLSASRRYFEHDLLTAPFRLDSGGGLEVPTGPGSGVEVDAREYRRRLLRRRRIGP